MGYALIVGGGPDGRYTISLDIGEAERTALVARFTIQNVDAQTELAAAEADLALKAAERAVAAAEYDDATTLLIQLLRGELPTATADEAKKIYDDHSKAQAKFLVALTAQNTALSARNAISFTASHLAKALAAWQAQVLTESRDAWCADLTEDATGYVKTLEIPGESDLILIAPGGTYPVLATDGYLRSRALMSPWQAFANAAILPGWQKFKPTYRWGTITALDEDTDTATVELAVARSSAQQLLVNQSSTLTNIPVVYLDCNAEAFEVGDRAVVEFQGQDWSAPRVIGFLDNPRPCELITVQYTQRRKSPESETGLPAGLGALVGEATQYVYRGKDASEVSAAEPVLGSAWYRWSDGDVSRSRHDLDIQMDAPPARIFTRYAEYLCFPLFMTLNRDLDIIEAPGGNLPGAPHIATFTFNGWNSGYYPTYVSGTLSFVTTKPWPTGGNFGAEFLANAPEYVVSWTKFGKVFVLRYVCTGNLDSLNDPIYELVEQSDDYV